MGIRSHKMGIGSQEMGIGSQEMGIGSQWDPVPTFETGHRVPKSGNRGTIWDPTPTKYRASSPGAPNHNWEHILESRNSQEAWESFKQEFLEISHKHAPEKNFHKLRGQTSLGMSGIS